MVSGSWRVLRRLISLGAAASLVLSAYALAPKALEIAQVLGIRDDPARVLLYRLSNLDKPAYDREIALALEKDDPELARSLANLAADRGFVLDPATLRAIADAEQFSILRTSRQLFTGAVTGEADNPTAFAGALAADLTVVGDVRDLTEQAFAYPDQDNLTVALAATGVLLTAATAVTVGTSTAGKVGVSAIKAARKMKRLSKGLERHLVRLAGDAVDTRVLRAMGDDLGKWNVTAAFDGARRLIKPRVVDEISDTGAALGNVFAKQGYRGTLQVLESADDTVDVRRLTRVSDDLGPRFRAALHLKKGAKLTLRVGEILFAFLGWIMALAGWILWAGWTALRLSIRTGRLLVHSIIRLRGPRPPSSDLQSSVNGSISASNS